MPAGPRSVNAVMARADVVKPVSPSDTANLVVQIY